MNNVVRRVGGNLLIVAGLVAWACVVFYVSYFVSSLIIVLVSSV